MCWKGDDTQTLSKNVQDSCLQLVEHFTTVTLPNDSADRAVNIIARTQRPSSVPALRRLAEHPSADVAKRAAALLAMMGEEAPAVNREPLQFRILVNGRPLPENTRIYWRIEKQDGNATSSTTETLPNGLIELAREEFTMPSNPAAKISLRASFEQSGCTFETEVPPPKDLSVVSDVKVRCSPLRIVLHNENRLNAPFSGRASIWLQAHSDDSSADRHPLDFGPKKQTPIDSRFELPLVQDGVYDIWIGLPGAELWHKVVLVNADTEPIDAVLEPGSDVYFSVVGPAGPMQSWGRLFKDGQPLEVSPDQDGWYRFLPCGNYVLVLPGSEIFDLNKMGGRIARGPDEVNFAGKQVALTIQKGSSPAIDLGEIKLDALPPKR